MFRFRPSRAFVGLVGFAATLGVAAVAAPLVATAQNVPIQGGGQQPQGISVVGEGIVFEQPNVARITLGVEVSSGSLTQAQSDAASRMDAVVRTLKESGIADQDIRTVSYSINPQYDFRDNTQTLRGYQVQNLVDVRTTNVPGLGQLLDAVVANGASRIFGIRFESDDPGRLKEQARDLAMQNARAKAEQLARSAGVSLGRAIYIQESDTGGVTPVQAQPAAAPAALAADRATTPIQPGEMRVRTTVTVVWAIQ